MSSDIPARALTPFGNFELHRSRLLTKPVRYVAPSTSTDLDRRQAALTVIEQVIGDRPDGRDEALEILRMLGLVPLRQEEEDRA